MTDRQQPDHVCVLPGDPSWLQSVAYLEDAFGLLGRATEVAEDGGDADRYVLTELTYRVAEKAIGRIKDGALAPESGRPTVCLVVMPAFELDALRKVLDVLRRAQESEKGSIQVRELIEGFGECFSPSRTVAAFVTDLARVVSVLTLDIPAVRNIATAFALDGAPGFDLDAAHEQLATVWRASGIRH